MAKCLRHVYSTMCEYDVKGNRKGVNKPAGVKYESRPKKGANAPTATAKKGANAPRRPTEAEITAAVTGLVNSFRNVYADLYDRRVNLALSTVEKADAFIKEHTRLVERFNNARQDILMSDREVVAFHQAVMRSKDKRLLLSLDRRMRK